MVERQRSSSVKIRAQKSQSSHEGVILEERIDHRRIFLNGHEHATLADLVRLRVKEWKRFANIRFNFNCSFEGSDIRINFEGLDSNCQIGCVCLSPRLVGKTTMKLKLNCNKAIMLHGMYLGLERSLFSTVHMLTCNMRVRA